MMKTAIHIWIIRLYALAANAEHGWQISNVRLFDGEQVHENVSVTFRDGEIQDITTQNVSLPGLAVVDGTGKTLMPGLINAHVHVFDTPDKSSVEQLKETAQAGVLTVLDLFSQVEPARKLRAQRDTPGQADYFSAGACATPPDGHGTQYGFPTPTLSSPEEAETFVEARLSEGSDYIKIILEDADGRAERLPAPAVAAVIQQTRQRDKVAVVHISRIQDAVLAFDSGASGLAHLWFRETTPADDATLTQFGTRPFFVTPTLIVIKEMDTNFFPHPKMAFELFAAEVKRLQDAGVTILAGTDSPNFGINAGTDLYREMQYMVLGGLTPGQALRSATCNVANAYSLNDRGRVAVGKRADLILVNGNPTKEISDLSRIEMIWQNGEKIR